MSLRPTRRTAAPGIAPADEDEGDDERPRGIGRMSDAGGARGGRRLAGQDYLPAGAVRRESFSFSERSPWAVALPLLQERAASDGRQLKLGDRELAVAAAEIE